jgi:hypothetical protein
LDGSSLAVLAGDTLVAAAVTDAWETARRKFIGLFARRSSAQAELAGRRLDATREQLTGAPGSAVEPDRTRVAAQWATRLADLLDEDPGAAVDLQVLVEEIRELLPAAAVSAAGHSVAAARDVHVEASGGSLAAGVIHGSVTVPGPTLPDPAGGSPDPGLPGPSGLVLP